MFDACSALKRFGAAFLALSALVLGEATTIAGVYVRRGSLFGFEVAGRVLDLDVAAAVLATAPDLAQTIIAPTMKVPAPPAELLRAPHVALGGFVSETWRASPAASRREACLRRALGPGVHRSTTRSRWGGAVTVELRYQASAKAPPIEP